MGRVEGTRLIKVKSSTYDFLMNEKKSKGYKSIDKVIVNLKEENLVVV